MLAGIGAALFALARASGGYYVDGWGAAGLVAAAACALVVVIGLVPARTVLAATAVLVLLGGWSLLSTSWGGIPFQGWRFFDQALLAASALVVGSALAATGRRALVVQAVLAALVLESLEPIVRAIARDVPEDWFYGRRFQGVFGYHSAQASACAVGSAIAVSLLDARRAVPRALYGAAATLMLSVLLLTQSRAGAGAAAAALLVAVLVRRDAAAFVRVVPVAVASGLLVLPLKAVDRALVDASGVDSALRSYAAWTLLAMAIVAAACAVPLRSQRLRLSLAVAVGVAAIAGAAVVTVLELRPGSAAAVLVDSLRKPDADPGTAPAGDTRLLSLSLNGRGDAWRVARKMADGALVTGRGQGTFPIFWTRERRLDQLYLLQPHNLFFELLAELGAVGLGFFVVALGLVVAGTRRAGRTTAAAAGALTALVGQAALDWTWSFPVLVIAAFLVAGSAAAGTRLARPGRWSIAAAVAVLAVGAVVFAPPWLSDRLVSQARALATTNPAAAAGDIDRALAWNRWNAGAYELHGLIRERGGQPVAAAADYREAARLSQSPWLDHYLVARAAKEAGDAGARADACAAAHRANPAEHRLRDALC